MLLIEWRVVKVGVIRISLIVMIGIVGVWSNRTSSSVRKPLLRILLPGGDNATTQNEECELHPVIRREETINTIISIAKHAYVTWVAVGYWVRRNCANVCSEPVSFIVWRCYSEWTDFLFAFLSAYFWHDELSCCAVYYTLPGWCIPVVSVSDFGLLIERPIRSSDRKISVASSNNCWKVQPVVSNSEISPFPIRRKSTFLCATIRSIFTVYHQGVISNSEQ